LRNEAKQKIAWQSGEGDTGRSKVAHTTLTFKTYRVGGAKLGGFLSGNEIEMSMCSYQLDYYCDCFEGENGNPEKKTFFRCHGKVQKRKNTKKKNSLLLYF